MASHFEIIENYLKDRKLYKTQQQLSQVMPTIYASALEDKKAAELLLKEPNRFMQNLKQHIKPEQLRLFLLKYPDLEASFQKMAGLSEDEMHLLRGLNKAEKPKVDGDPPVIRSDMNRTKLAGQYNDRIKFIHGQPHIHYQNNDYPVVTRDLRNFNQRVFSAGTSPSREILMLDPDSKVLKDLYSELRQAIKQGATTKEVLEEISKLTNKAFPVSQDARLSEFIAEQLKKGSPFISLDSFMKAGIGLCRHHALLNAYLMSRLVEDGILQGQVIHQRHSFPNRGVHTWNLFRDTKDGKLYSLDSLWKKVTSLADNPGDLNKRYRLDVESSIQAAFGKFQLPSKQKADTPNHFPPKPIPAVNHVLLEILLAPPQHLKINNDLPYDNFKLGDDWEQFKKHDSVDKLIKPEQNPVNEEIMLIKIKPENELEKIDDFQEYNNNKSFKI
ncbi:TPA: hypothetical protein ACTXXA_002178 [Legionella anisa]